MDQPCCPLIEVVAEIPDPRQARGARSPLTIRLALARVTMRCGYRSDGAIAAWGRNEGAEAPRALGRAGMSAPGAATPYLLMRALDRAAVDAALLRNTALGLPLRTGASTIAAACRHYAAQPWDAFALLGLTPKNDIALEGAATHHSTTHYHSRDT